MTLTRSQRHYRLVGVLYLIAGILTMLAPFAVMSWIVYRAMTCCRWCG